MNNTLEAALAQALQPDVASYYDENSIGFTQRKLDFLRILESEDFGYKHRVEYMLKEGKRRLIIDLSQFASTQREMYLDIQSAPIQFIAPFQRALQQFIRDNFKQDPSLHVNDRYNYSVGFSGLETDRNLTPRDLKAGNVGRLLCVEGIATRCSLVRAKVGQSVHYCDATDRYTTSYYHDNTSLTGLQTNTGYPTADENGNALSTEYGLSFFYNTQSLGLQEMPENTPQGLLPCSINVVMNDDLVDNCKPGDRIRVTGVYRALPSHSTGYTNSGLFGSIFIALNLEKIENKLKSTSLDSNDMKKIHQFAKRPDCLRILSQSIAPSIYGHAHIKRALLLLLLGGIEKNLDTGTHIRGDINVLMVGDPSTAKSQLLRFVLHLAPLAINTTGRGSSGVGLTAAIVTDKDTGERRLEAGAMVLADRGVVCIDEFDKMNEMDRVAIHEVMEQQTVTISKAGVHMSLNSRCSVVAAANPIYGKYDIALRPHVNVGLADSLLSRFDLLFIVLDRPSEQLDRTIAGRVLDNHTSNIAALRDLDEDQPLDPADATTIQIQETQVYSNTAQRQASIANSPHGTPVNSSNDRLTLDFLRKYINYAKGLNIVLSEQACEYISRRYAEIRQRARNRDDSSLPITARLLETLIRLSTAVAKSRLGGVVTRQDATIAYKLLAFALSAAEQVGKEFEEFGDDPDDLFFRGGDGADDDSDDDHDGRPGDPREDPEWDPEDDSLESALLLDKLLPRKKKGRTGTTSTTAAMGSDSDFSGDENWAPTSGSTRRVTRSQGAAMGDEIDWQDDSESSEEETLATPKGRGKKKAATIKKAELKSKPIPKLKKGKQSTMGDDDDDNQELSSQSTTRRMAAKKTPIKPVAQTLDSSDDDDDNWGDDEETRMGRDRRSRHTNNRRNDESDDELVALSDERVTTFRRAFAHCTDLGRIEPGLPYSSREMLRHINNAVTSSNKFTPAEFEIMMEQLDAITKTDEGDWIL